MKIDLLKVTIREVAEGYKDNQEEGVVGYNGQLNIRPAYQREFIYDDKKRNAVMDTVLKGFPLNVMYWAKNDGSYEVLDGQQRTISFCQFVDGKYSVPVNGKLQYFHSLPKDIQKRIFDYELMVYVCEGSDSEKLEWFKTINIAGEKLTDQELRNAVYTGKWLSSAKKYFSKTACAAYQMGSKYVPGSPIRQELLETALRWICKEKGISTIEEYMASHQADPTAVELTTHYDTVLTWVRSTFKIYRKEMKGVDWGTLYTDYHENPDGNGKPYDPDEMEKKVSVLMMDDEVKNKKGIYEYVFDGKEKHLNLRAFENNTKRAVYEQQKGICSICKKHFDIDQMEADHIKPWSQGGKTEKENCQMLCKDCNREKSDK